MSDLSILEPEASLDAPPTSCKRCSKRLDDRRREQSYSLCEPCEHKLTTTINLFVLIRGAVLIIAIALLIGLIPILLARPLSHGYYSIPGTGGRSPTVMNGTFVFMMKVLCVGASAICFALYFWANSKLNRMKNELL